MPAMTLGLFFMATYTRMTRASMLEVKRLDFVKTARAKGLSDAVIQRRDVFAGMIFGARVSLLVGLVSTLVALLAARAVNFNISKARRLAWSANPAPANRRWRAAAPEHAYTRELLAAVPGRKEQVA